MIEDVNNFNILTSDSEKATRINICKTCDERQIISDSELCMKCACPIEYAVTYKYKECPLGKWEI
jgi:hypothetical protein